MSRLFWLSAGVVIGAMGYRYFREQGGSLDSLAASGSQLASRAQDMVSSSGMGDKAQKVADRVGTAARETVESAKGHATAMKDETLSSGVSSETAKRHAKDMASEVQGTVTRLREDVKDDLRSGTSGP